MVNKGWVADHGTSSSMVVGIAEQE